MTEHPETECPSCSQTSDLMFSSSRELVIQKVSGCCRRGNQVSYKYSKVGRSHEDTSHLMDSSF